MKDSAVEHARKEDDGNNALYVNYTYHTGGRRDTANDVFGGQAIYKK